MTGVLSTFGVGPDAELLYRTVLRRDGERLGQHAATLGWDLDRARAALEPLVELRLVRQALDDALVAPAPRASLNRLVDREAARLDLRRRELEDVVAAVGDFSADHVAGRVDVLDPASLEAIPAEALPASVERLLATTTGPIRSFHLEVAAGAAADEGVEQSARDALRSGRELRSIYPVSVLDDDAQLAWVRHWATLGERQRVIEKVPTEFVVLGSEAVISAPTWAASASSAVLIRMPLMVAAFTAIFDEAWAGGLPVPDEGVGQNPETRLLALLASGFKDEAIARYLGLGVRTVRRRVAELMDELSVHTRFQLGVVAERRGMLGRRS